MKEIAYINKSHTVSIKEFLMHDQKRYYEKITTISRRLRRLRDKKTKNVIDIITIAILTIRRNRVAPKRNVWLQGKIGNNSRIYHANVIVNQYATIGDNVVFHGDNCVGNNGKDEGACPRIGDNVEFGYGSCAYGDIEIADGTVIGAGAVVIESILEPNTVVAGVPAKRIR